MSEGTEDVNLGPGLTEAEKFGRGLKQGWVAEVSTNSPDFEEVSLRLGPTAGDWQRWAKIRWDNGADGYTLVEEGDIAYDDTSTDAGTTTTGPGKHLATKTALANSPGWVAKVVRHAADWRSGHGDRPHRHDPHRSGEHPRCHPVPAAEELAGRGGLPICAPPRDESAVTSPGVGSRGAGKWVP